LPKINFEQIELQNTPPNTILQIQKGLGKISQPFNFWLPIVDEFRNFLMSEDANIVLEQIEDF